MIEKIGSSALRPDGELQCINMAPGTRSPELTIIVHTRFWVLFLLLSLYIWKGLR
jgi:hypothetical protein